MEMPDIINFPWRDFEKVMFKHMREINRDERVQHFRMSEVVQVYKIMPPEINKRDFLNGAIAYFHTWHPEEYKYLERWIKINNLF